MKSRFEAAFVWTGGALFVTALAVCAYSYLWRWSGVIGDADRSTGFAVNTLLFFTFAAHHSLFARDTAKRWVTRMVSERLIRSLYVWVASALLLSVLIFWRPLPGDLYDVAGWRWLVHAAVQLAGVGVIARSVARIDALALAGIKSRAETEGLQADGPYRWVRHPLYLGWVLAVFGAPHMTVNRLAFAVLTTAYLVVAIPWEEAALFRAFGEEYARYCRQVRWRIVPYIY